jgi:hypothetical protein
MGHPNHNSRERLVSHLKSNKLNEPCYFTNNRIVGFHWSNDKLSSDYFKRLYRKKDGDFNQRIKLVKEELENLKTTPVWLVSKRGQIKSSLYHLYECYLDPRLKHQWFDIEDIQVSTQHEAGPFCKVNSMRWFNKEEYSKFVYLKMLEGWVPQRNFRLNFNIPFEARADGSPFGAIQTNLVQMHEYGLLLHFTNVNSMKEWVDKEITFIKSPIKLNRDFENSGVEEIFKASKWLEALDNFSVRGDLFVEKLEECLKSQGENNHYIFISFDELIWESNDGHQKSVEHIKTLVNEAKDVIHSYIKAA